MTRGKHGISAAARQAVGEREKQIEAYQHNVRKLTAENAELRQKIADMQDAHTKTVRVLKAERDEGVSPQMKVLQERNEQLEARFQRWKLNWQKAEIAYKATSDALTEAYEAAGMRTADARERALHVGVYSFDSSGAVVRVDDVTVTYDTAGVAKSLQGGQPTEKEKAAVRAVQRAKGLRR